MKGGYRWVLRQLCLVTQSCPTCAATLAVACQATVHGIFQARMLEWVSMPSSRGSSWPKDQTHISCVYCIAVKLFHWATRGALFLYTWTIIFTSFRGVFIGMWLRAIVILWLFFWEQAFEIMHCCRNSSVLVRVLVGKSYHSFKESHQGEEWVELRELTKIVEVAKG